LVRERFGRHIRPNEERAAMQRPNTTTTPLETFLTSVSGPSADETTKDAGLVAARRLVVLTILDQEEGAIPDETLRIRSELSPDSYRNTLSDLVGQGLIQQQPAGDWGITDAGRLVAQQGRGRLLSLG
jgi:hypothetical protein